MGYASLTDSTVRTTVSKDVNTIRTETVNWEVVNIVQHTTTTTTEYRGITEEDADSVNVSYQHKTSAEGDTTKTLGGVRITVTKQSGSIIVTRDIPIYGVRGVQQTAVKSRVNDSNLFQVVVTRKEMSIEVDNPNATVTDI